MHKMGSPGYSLFLLPLVFALCGCSKGDKDRLAGLGSHLAHKAQTWLAAPEGGLGRSLGVVPLSLREMAIDARVSARLMWEKSLADASIEVHAIGGLVELRGKVRSREQGSRALELALATVGVENVSDKLEVEQNP